jgi:hypothetical protein
VLCLLIGAVLEFHELTILPSVTELHVLPGTVSMGVAVPNFGIKTKTQLHSLLHFLAPPRNQSEGPAPKKVIYVIYTVRGKVTVSIIPPTLNIQSIFYHQGYIISEINSNIKRNN